MKRLFNVFLQEVEAKGRKFISASVNVKPSSDNKEDRDFYNVKVVQGFGEMPTTKGFHVIECHDNDMWLDNQENVDKVIRVRNPKFVRQGEVVYDVPYNQLDVVNTRVETKIVKITLDDATKEAEKPKNDINNIPQKLGDDGLPF